MIKIMGFLASFVMNEEVKKAQAVFKRKPTLKNQLAVNARAVLPALFQSLVVDDNHQLPIRPDLTHGAEQYLQRLDNWGEFELYLFMVFSVAMPAATQRRLMNIALNRSRHYRHFLNAPLLAHHLLENQITLELTRQDIPAAARYLSQLETALEKQPSAEFALWARCHTAELDVRKGQPQEAAALLDQIIQIATTLKLTNLAEVFVFMRPIILNEPPTSAYKYFHVMFD